MRVFPSATKLFPRVMLLFVPTHLLAGDRQSHFTARKLFVAVNQIESKNCTDSALRRRYFETGCSIPR